MAVDYPIMCLIAFFIHPGSPYGSMLFEAIMEELQKKRIIRKGDITIFDKRYYSTGTIKYGYPSIESSFSSSLTVMPALTEF